jgi:hypothetical protein
MLCAIPPAFRGIGEVNLLRTVSKWFEFIYGAKREELGYLVDVLVKGPISPEEERTYKLELRLLSLDGLQAPMYVGTGLGASLEGQLSTQGQRQRQRETEWFDRRKMKLFFNR